MRRSASSSILSSSILEFIALDEDITLKKKIAVSLDPAPRLIGDIQVLPYRHFLQLLWNGEI